MRRVVVTGIGVVSPLGIGVATLMEGLMSNRSGISRLEALEGVRGLRPRLGGVVKGCDGAHIPRKYRRSMTAMSIFATVAASEALAQADVDHDRLSHSRTGLCLGSTLGSAYALQDFFGHYLPATSIEGIRSTEFFKIMNHTCAANLTQYFGITGRVMAPSAACSTGCQAVGLAAECIASGKQDLMLCGGAEELHPLTVGTFDIIQAASTAFNNDPESTPRPFDDARDGIVCAEGAGMLLLESLDSAKARGSRILGEIVGFASTADPSNLASPCPQSIAACMHSALEDAGLSPGDIDYVNAHATGTVLGDAAEAEAIAEIFGARPSVSSLKGHLGHTMAASGAIELVACLEMMRLGVIVPTRNLAASTYACSLRMPLTLERGLFTVFLKNSFGLGGINTAIVLRRYDDRD